MIRNKLFLAIALLLASMPSVPMEMRETSSSWRVMSDMNDAERREFLLGKAKANLERKANERAAVLEDYFYNTQAMDIYGKSFTYLGNVEKEFLDLIQTIDDENRTVLLPACGYGRVVLDALAKTRHLKVIANDISDSGTEVLREGAAHWFPQASERLTVDHGDIFDLLKRTESESVDSVFTTHLIHFFSPSAVELFIYELNRVLKPNGKAFIVWEGIQQEYSYNIQDSGLDKYCQLVKEKRSAPVKYSYISKEIFRKELDGTDLRGPHNFLSTDEMNAIVAAGGFEAKEQRNFIPMNCRGTMPIACEVGGMSFQVPQNFCFIYRESAITPGETLVCYACSLMLIEKIGKPAKEMGWFSKDYTSGAWKDTVEKHKCDRCTKFVAKIMRCGACKSRKYCSKSCQGSDWSSHRSTCKKLAIPDRQQ